MEIYRSLETLQRDVANRVYTCTQITQFYIKNIQDNDSYNAFLEVFETSALEQAEHIDDKIKNKIVSFITLK